MQALNDLGADGGLGNFFAEVLYYMVVNISFQQRLSHIAHRVRDIGFGDSAPAR